MKSYFPVPEQTVGDSFATVFLKRLRICLIALYNKYDRQCDAKQWCKLIDDEQSGDTWELMYKCCYNMMGGWCKQHKKTLTRGVDFITTEDCLQEFKFDANSRLPTFHYERKSKITLFVLVRSRQPSAWSAPTQRSRKKSAQELWPCFEVLVLPKYKLRKSSF